MAVLPLQCPHCLAMTNLRVTGYSLSPVPEEKLLPPFVSFLCECPECHKRVGVLTRPTNQADSESTPNSISNGFGNLMKATVTIAENGLTLVSLGLRHCRQTFQNLCQT